MYVLAHASSQTCWIPWASWKLVDARYKIPDKVNSSTYTKVDHMLGQKELFKGLKSDFNGAELEINNKKITRKCLYKWKLRNTK